MKMKIRIKGNTLRYRLTRSDVNQFEKEGYLEDRTEFMQVRSLIYALQKDKRAKSNCRLLYGGSYYHVADLPMPVCWTQWINTDIVGF